MASASDFNKLQDIKGVYQYILVRNDGHIVTSNAPNAVEFSSSIIMSGTHFKNLENILDSGHSSYLCVEPNQGSNFLIFTLGNYFLGIIEQPDSDTKTTVNSIISYLQTIS